MNHKRRRPKNRRAGCLFCKPHKANHAARSGEKDRLAALNRERKNEVRKVLQGAT